MTDGAIIGADPALPSRSLATAGRRPDPFRFMSLAMLAVVAVLVLPPVFVLVQNSLFVMNADGSHGAFTLDNFTHLFDDSNILRSGWNSVQFAALSTVFSLLFGGSLAWVVERTDTPARGLAYLMTTVSLGIPLIIYVPAWLFFLGPVGPPNTVYHQLGGEGVLFNVNSITGMVMIETLGWLPLSFLLFAASFRAANAELEEAARMAGASIPTMVRRISVPLAAPAALATGLFIFINTLQAFDVPKLVGTSAGIKLLTTDIYDDIREAVPPQVGHASAYSIVLTIVVAGLMVLYSRLSLNASRFATVTGKGFRPRPLPLGRFRWLAGAFVWANFLIILGIPILTLLWLSLTPYVQAVRLAAFGNLSLDNYRIVLGGGGHYLDLVVNTLITAIGAATVTMALMVVCGWLVARRRSLHTALDQLITLPMLLPGIVLSVAMMDLALRSPVPLYSTLTILVLAFVIHYLPYGMRYTFSGVLQIHKELEESAGVSGASPAVTLRKVVVPLLWPSILAGWLFIFLNASRDLSTAIILAGPDTKTIAVAIFDQATNGDFGEVAALGLAWSFLMSSVAVAFYMVMRRRGGSAFGL